MKEHSVLVIGSGGREHALVHSLAQSQDIKTIYCAPGNAGIGRHAQLVDLNIQDQAAVLRFVREKNIQLTVIGPEAPLVAGLSDALRKEGHLVVGAGQKAALLEGSKIFAKTFMSKYNIPTARFRVFDKADQAKAFAASKEGQRYLVVKADGLAAGKGVVVGSSPNDVLDAIDEFLTQKKFGRAGERIVLEEALEGPEVSVIALTDGKTVLPLPASQDHKRAFDNDEGPNTGGMGAYAPTPFYDDPTRIKVNKHIVENFLRGIQSEGMDFRGIVYFGLMLTASGPKVLEFNVRFGDPEAQVVLPLIESDLFHVFTSVAKGELSHVGLKIKPLAACTVVMASKGYPGSYETGLPINGLETVEKEGRVIVFHAGTKKDGHKFLTNGGRVLSVTGLGKTLDSAVVRAYQGVKKISFPEAHFRNDIGTQALRDKRIGQRIKRMKRRYVQSAAFSLV